MYTLDEAIKITRSKSDMISSNSLVDKAKLIANGNGYFLLEQGYNVFPNPDYYVYINTLGRVLYAGEDRQYAITLLMSKLAEME